jgi:lipopolysaccharide/colanic/teichoic acid biosynthesis glycosyltransferase
MDIVLSIAFLFIFLPVGLLIAGLIALDSKGPVFFRQRRYGAHCRPFFIYKFRTMHVMESEGSFTQAFAGDARITRIGRFLRSTSLDEMPQLWNVLRGEMSLVGPRPHAIAMDDAFVKVISNYSDRHLVKPGLTGLAQIAGHRGPTEAASKIAARVRCDRLYIRKWSVWLDLVILCKTAFALKGPNAL